AASSPSVQRTDIPLLQGAGPCRMPIVSRCRNSSLWQAPVACDFPLQERTGSGFEERFAVQTPGLETVSGLEVTGGEERSVGIVLVDLRCADLGQRAEQLPGTFKSRLRMERLVRKDMENRERFTGGRLRRQPEGPSDILRADIVPER